MLVYSTEDCFAGMCKITRTIDSLLHHMKCLRHQHIFIVNYETYYSVRRKYNHFAVNGETVKCSGSRVVKSI